ncbi:MAG: hypothetical protein Q8R28_12430 [Dehalococcoidia bacterium]|nr:hypothetical protein [Dehalococcoidia bacterium]
MPRINLDGQGGRMGGAINFLVVRMALAKVKPYEAEIRKIKPSDILVLITQGIDLMALVPQDSAEDYPIKDLARLSTDMVIAVLEKVHPDLATVLSTQAGRAWWEQQRRLAR